MSGSPTKDFGDDKAKAPQDGGMIMLKDTHNRKIDYLRISVTDKCNLKCVYCMPANVVFQKPRMQVLTFEEIIEIVKAAAGLGISKIKITGGEPLLRRDFPKLLSQFFRVSGIEEISLTTNAVLLAKFAKELKASGLKKINISLDTLEADKFGQISGFFCLEQVLEGIEAALEQDFLVKLNVVVLRGVNDNEILNFARFAMEKNIILRFIELMPMVRSLVNCHPEECSDEGSNLFVSGAEIKERLELLGCLKPFSFRLGNGPARYYKLSGTSLIVGFINPISDKFCFSCNRLRLTAEGMLLPCLNSKSGFDLKNPLRRNKKEEVLGLFKKAVYSKPEGHNLSFASCGENLMCQIGG